MPNLMKLTLFSMLMLGCFNVFAQDYTITGIVKDSTQTIVFANVILTNSNGEITTGTITEEDGGFNLTTQQGTYTLTVSFLGYQTWEQSVVVSENIDIGSIILEQQNNELDEVVVTGKKPTLVKKVDRIEFNISNTILSEGDAWEALKKAPGVITSTSGALQIFGKSGVMVMIDERPIQLSSDELKNMLEGMSANEINSIEIITNPPAKYDAEGNGIINITLKKKKSLGYNGSVFSRYTQGVFPKSSNGGSIIHRGEKINASANYNFGIGKKNIQEDSDVNFLDSQSNPYSLWNENSDRNTNYLSHNFRTALDYYISDKSIIGVKIDGNLSPKQSIINKTITEVYNYQNELDSLFVNDNSTNRNVQNLSYNINFTQDFKRKGQSLTMDFDYVDYGNEGVQNVNTNFFNSDYDYIRNEFFTSDTKQDIEIYSSKADYSQPIDSTSHFETGIKFNSIETDNDLVYFTKDNSGDLVYDESRSNQFLYDEDTYAGYLSYSKSLKNIFVKLGLRAEYTKTKGNSITLNEVANNDYLELFPSAFFQYQMDNNNSLGLSYSRRIKRPNYSLLNPFQFFTSPYSYIEGNPFLQPAFSDNIELSYKIKSKFFFTLYFNYTKEPFTQISVQDNENQIFSYQAVNLDSDLLYGLFFYTSHNINQWWSLYFNLDINYNKYEFIDPNNENTLINNDQWAIAPYLWNEFTISKKDNLSIEVIAQYFSRKVQGGFDINERSEISIGIKKKLFNNKATLSIYSADLFNQNKFTLKSNYASQSHVFRENPENQHIRLSFTYRFGNTDIKSRNRKNSNEDEKKRI